MNTTKKTTPWSDVRTKRPVDEAAVAEHVARMPITQPTISVRLATSTTPGWQPSSPTSKPSAAASRSPQHSASSLAQCMTNATR